MKVEKLNVNLGGRHVLADISFEVGPGQLLGLIGPNGAGKTTLIRAITGLIPITSGTITCDGRIGYVPQHRDIAWDYPIAIDQVVATTMLARRRRLTTAAWRAVYDALDLVGMLDLRDRTLAELSGGQKQRVLVARALVEKPDVLLLDEPFTGLDHPNQDSLSDLFVDLARRGSTIIMSTHDLTQAVDMCSDLAMLNRTLRAMGRPADLLIPDLWVETYNVRPDSALIRSLGMS